jgi:hypothetical protein
MSRIALSGNPSGSGTLTIASPNTNTDRTLTLPDTSGTLLDSTGSTTMTNLTVTNGASIQGLTVGRGAGAVSTNTVVGAIALAANTTGYGNTAVGRATLSSNTTGNNNTAVGPTNAVDVGAALAANTTGSQNIAFGGGALNSNTTASNNTAVGYQAGFSNTTGQFQLFLGYQAGRDVTTGTNNTFVGHLAGELVTTGTKNVILGRYSGNFGGLDIRTSNNNIVLSDGDGNPRGYHDATNWYFPSVDSQTTGSAANVNVGTNGVLRRSTSSLKYKRDVQDTLHGLNELLELRAVVYKSKSALDGETIYGGLIAEEVHEAGLTEFVQYAEDGSPDALAYGNMVSLCIKAIQELNAKVEALEAQLKGTQP